MRRLYNNVCPIVLRFSSDNLWTEAMHAIGLAGRYARKAEAKGFCFIQSMCLETQHQLHGITAVILIIVIICPVGVLPMLTPMVIPRIQVRLFLLSPDICESPQH